MFAIRDMNDMIVIFARQNILCDVYFYVEKHFGEPKCHLAGANDQRDFSSASSSLKTSLRPRCAERTSLLRTKV